MFGVLATVLALACLAAQARGEAVACAGSQGPGSVALSEQGVTLLLQFRTPGKNASTRVTTLASVTGEGYALRAEYDASFRALAIRQSCGSVLYEIFQSRQEDVTAVVTAQAGRTRVFLNGSLAYDAAEGCAPPPGPGTLSAGSRARLVAAYSPPLSPSGAADMSAGAAAPRCDGPDEPPGPAGGCPAPAAAWPCGSAATEGATLAPPFTLGMNVTTESHARLFAFPFFTADFDPATNFSLVVWGNHHAFFRPPGVGAWLFSVGARGEATLRVNGTRVATAYRPSVWKGTRVPAGAPLRAEAAAGCDATLWNDDKVTCL